MRALFEDQTQEYESCTDQFDDQADYDNRALGAFRIAKRIAPETVLDLIPDRFEQ